MDTTEIRSQLESFMYNRNDISKRFITEENLLAVWTDNLSKTFPYPQWHSDHVCKIRKSYLKVLSILVLIGWPNSRINESLFQDSFLQFERSDQCLPFARDQLDLPDHLAESFDDWQYAFCPVLIEERDGGYNLGGEIQTVPAKFRLPLIEGNARERELGCGAFGIVQQVEIARQYCRRHYDTNRQDVNSKVNIIRI